MTVAWVKRVPFLLPSLVLGFCFLINTLVRETAHSFCNTNYGFGFLEPEPFLMFFEWGTLAVLFVLYLRTIKWADKIIFSILLGAGLANTLERLMYGCVVDTFELPVVGSQINIPDVLMTVAVLGLVWRYSIESRS